MDSATYYSYINMVLLSVIGGVIVMMVGMLGYWASNVNAKLQASTDGLAELKIWAKGHDKQDDERHDENRTRLDRTYEEVHDIRTAFPPRVRHEWEEKKA